MTSSAERIENLSYHRTEELRFGDLVPKRIHLLLILVLAVLGALAAFLYTVQAPRLYTSTATIELNQNSSSTGLRDFSSTPTQTGTGPDFVLDLLTTQEALNSDETATTVIQKLNLLSQYPYNQGPNDPEYKRQLQLPLEQAPMVRDRAVAIFKSGLQVTPVKNTRLLAVAYSDRNPSRAALIANTIVDSYSTNYSKARSLATGENVDLLNDQLAKLQQHVDEVHAKINALEASTGMVGGAPLLQATPTGSYNPNALNSPAYLRLNSLEEERSRVQKVLLSKKAVYDLTRTGDAETVLQISGAYLAQDGNPSSGLTGASRAIQLIQTLNVQDASLKIRLAAEQVSLGAKNPTVLELQAQEDVVRKQIATQVNNVRKTAETEYLLAKAEDEALAESIATQQKKIEGNSQSIAELAFLQQDEDTSRSLYQSAFNKLKEADVAAGVKSATITVVDPARISSQPSSPAVKKDVLVGVGVGALIGYFVALFIKLREFSARTRFSPAV